MDPQIKNFSQIEKFIRENPRDADAQAFEWQQFLKTNPELFAVQTLGEFEEWAKEHPEKNVDTSVWVGKEISEAYYYLREQHEERQMQAEEEVDVAKVPQELASPVFLAAAFLIKPRIMRDDRDYQKIEKKLKAEWLKKNPGKDFSSKEGIDYLYGSLDNNSQTSMRKEAEEAFRNDPRFKNKVERYDKEKKKIYKDPKDDPNLSASNEVAEDHIRARLEYFKTHDMKGSPEEISSLIQKQSYDGFVARHPEKAKAYSGKIEGIKIAYEKNQTKETLSSYNKTSGKDVRYVEKAHRAPPSISIADATRRLEQISQPQEIPSYTINVSSSPRIQTSQSSLPRQTQGGGKAINSINNLANKFNGGIPNPLGRVGSKIAQQAGKGLIRFLAANPWVWGTLGTLILGISVFTIVFSGAPGGAPGAFTPDQNNQTTGRASGANPLTQCPPQIITITQAPEAPSVITPSAVPATPSPGVYVGTTMVSGHVYIDVNKNGIKDAGENDCNPSAITYRGQTYIQDSAQECDEDNNCSLNLNRGYFINPISAERLPITYSSLPAEYKMTTPNSYGVQEGYCVNGMYPGVTCQVNPFYSPPQVVVDNLNFGIIIKP